LRNSALRLGTVIDEQRERRAARNGLNAEAPPVPAKQVEARAPHPRSDSS